MPISGRMDKQIVAWSYNGVLLSKTKGNKLILPYRGISKPCCIKDVRINKVHSVRFQLSEVQEQEELTSGVKNQEGGTSG